MASFMIAPPPGATGWFDGEYAVIPEHMQQALLRYVTEGVQPGDFLTAVIRNDLRNAVMRADEENLPLIKLYLLWFYNVAPQGCHGSFDMMEQWMASVRVTYD